MAVITIKDPSNNNIAKVDSTGRLFTLAEVTPASPFQVDLFDANSNPINSTTGALNVFVTNGTATGTALSVLNYNEITNVAPGVESTVVSYTAGMVGQQFLLLNEVSGENIGEVKVYRNGVAMDKKYLSYMSFNVDFDYRSDSAACPGYKLTGGDLIEIKATNRGNSNCSFNGKIQVLEVT